MHQYEESNLNCDFSYLSISGMRKNLYYAPAADKPENCGAGSLSSVRPFEALKRISDPNSRSCAQAILTDTNLS